MPKITVKIVLVAICFTAAYAIPAPKAVDWVAAREKVDEIQVEAINSNFEKLIAVAAKDDPGNQIGFEVNIFNSLNIRPFTRELEFRIADQTLTVQHVSDTLYGVRTELGILLGMRLPPHLALLTEPAAKKIKIYFDKVHSSLNLKQGELYAILMEGKVSKQ